MSQSNKKYKLGVALGGGGARGFAHLGVLKALEEKGIKPDIISGVSAGAIVGAFIASGKSIDDTFSIMKRYNFTGITRLTTLRNGLLSLSKMKANLEKHIKVENIEDLDLPLIITVSNMLEGRVEYLTEGPLSTIVQASSSIPVLFSPVEYRGTLYGDGGIFDNLPIKPISTICEKTIAINISPIQSIDDLKNLKEAAIRMFQLTLDTPWEDLDTTNTICIAPTDLEKYDIMDTKNADSIYQLGYDYARQLEVDL